MFGKLVKRLLMLGVSADSTNEDGLTALHQVFFKHRTKSIYFEIN